MSASKNNTISLRVDDKTVDYLKEQSEKLGISMSRLIIIFIKKGIKSEITKQVDKAIN